MAEHSAPDLPEGETPDAVETEDMMHSEELSQFTIPETLPFTAVEINSLVLLKIIKHCQDYHAEGDFDSERARDANGILAGMAVENDKQAILQIQNCFSLPPQLSEKDSESFTTAMFQSLREVNVDNNNVGFFQSGNLSTAVNDFPVVRDTLVRYQMQLKNHVVCIVYDPAAATFGQLAIKAFRLSPDFMDAVKAGQHKRHRDGGLGPAAAAFAAQSKKSIIEEVPIKIKDLSLSKALVWDLHAQNLGACDNLQLSVNPYMRQSLSLLSSTVENAKEYQKRMLQYGRNLGARNKERQEWRQQRRMDNVMLKKQKKRPLPLVDRSLEIFKEVSFPVGVREGEDGRDGRLQAHLSSRRVVSTCKQMDQFAGASFDKLYLASGFHSK